MEKKYELMGMDDYVLFQITAIPLIYIISRDEVLYTNHHQYLGKYTSKCILVETMRHNLGSLYPRKIIFNFIFAQAPYSKVEIDSLPQWFIEEYTLRRLEE